MCLKKPDGSFAHGDIHSREEAARVGQLLTPAAGEALFSAVAKGIPSLKSRQAVPQEATKEKSSKGKGKKR